MDATRKGTFETNSHQEKTKPPQITTAKALAPQPEQTLGLQLKGSKPKENKSKDK